MPKKAKEIRPITEQGLKVDPQCGVCGKVPKGQISASNLWGWAKKQTLPIKPFREKSK